SSWRRREICRGGAVDPPSPLRGGIEGGGPSVDHSTTPTPGPSPQGGGERESWFWEQRMKILAIGAHPDDVEILMGGTVAAFQAQGDEVVVAIATDGAKGGTMEPAELVKVRQREAAEAAAVFGLVPLMLG